MIVKNLLQVYALFVCFISTLILIVGSVILLQSLTDLIFPEFMNYDSLRKYETNESYRQSLEKAAIQQKDDWENEYKVQRESAHKYLQMTPKELEEKRRQERKEFIEGRKHSSLVGIVKNLEWLVVALIFFFLHWRLYKRAKEQA